MQFQALLYQVRIGGMLCLSFGVVHAFGGALLCSLGQLLRIHRNGLQLGLYCNKVLLHVHFGPSGSAAMAKRECVLDVR
jgi:hypothetical protein